MEDLFFNPWEYVVNIPYKKDSDSDFRMVMVSEEGWENFKEIVELGVRAKGMTIEVNWNEVTNEPKVTP